MRITGSLSQLMMPNMVVTAAPTHNMGYPKSADPISDIILNIVVAILPAGAVLDVVVTAAIPVAAAQISGTALDMVLAAAI